MNEAMHLIILNRIKIRVGEMLLANRDGFEVHNCLVLLEWACIDLVRKIDQ